MGCGASYLPSKEQNPDLSEKQMELIRNMNPEVKVRESISLPFFFPPANFYNFWKDSPALVVPVQPRVTGTASYKNFLLRSNGSSHAHAVRLTDDYKSNTPNQHPTRHFPARPHAVLLSVSQQMCHEIFLAKDHSGDGTITLEDHDFGAAFIQQHDLNKDGKVTLNEYVHMCALKSAASKKWLPNRRTGI